MGDKTDQGLGKKTLKKISNTHPEIKDRAGERRERAGKEQAAEEETESGAEGNRSRVRGETSLQGWTMSPQPKSQWVSERRSGRSEFTITHTQKWPPGY